MTESSNSLGDFIRSARIEADLSLRELARRIAKTPSYLSDIENDRRVPSEEVLMHIASELSLDFDELVARAGRIGAEAERLIRRSPEAVRLFRTVSAKNLGDEDLRKLRQAAERLAKKREQE